MPDKSPNLSELHALYEEAMAEYESAHAKAEAASSVETTARNKLNNAQKALDKALEDLRLKAPWNTDWHNERQRHHKAA